MALFLCANMAYAQTDPTVMKVGGVPVSRSEFEFCYNRDIIQDGEPSGLTVEKYLPYYIDFRLKLAEAKALRLDTIKALTEDNAGTKLNIGDAAMANYAGMEEEARRVYDEMKANVGQRGLILPAHIFIYVRQNASNAVFENARRRADSIYTAIKNGADFAALARRCSDDKTTAGNGGRLPWMQQNETLKEVEDAVFALKTGEVSRPVLTPFGFHIIKVLQRKQLESYDSLKRSILKALNERGIREQITAGKVIEMQKSPNIPLTNKGTLAEKRTEVEQNNPTVKFQTKLYRDEILAFEAQKRFIEGKQPYTPAILKAYFKKNKKRYYWDEPRFKVIIIHAKTLQDIEKAKDCIKNLPYEKWEEVIERTCNNGPEKRVKYEKGLFVKGQNKYVDGIFGTKKVAELHDDEFTYTDIYGKKLKKKAVTYDDVSRWVEDDYESELSRQWLNGLKEKYPVEVFNNVLQTVNKHNK